MQTLKKKRSGAQQARRKLQRASAVIETCADEHEVMAAFNEIDRVRKKRSGNMKLRKREAKKFGVPLPPSPIYPPDLERPMSMQYSPDLEPMSPPSDSDHAVDSDHDALQELNTALRPPEPSSSSSSKPMHTSGSSEPSIYRSDTSAASQPTLADTSAASQPTSRVQS